MDNVSDIISKYNGVIEKSVSLYRVRAYMYGVDLDDLRQDCRIELWNCLKKKPESDPYFLPYVRTSLRRKIHEVLIRKSDGCSHQNFYKQNRTFVNASDVVVQLSPDDTSHDILYSYADHMHETAVVTDFIEFCAARSPEYAEIIKDRMSGLTTRETAMKEGIHRTVLDRKIVNIKDLYKEYFGVDTNAPDDPRIIG